MARIIQRLSLIHETLLSGVANPLELSPAPDSLQALFGYGECETSWSLCPWREDSTHGHHQMVSTEIRLIIFFAAKDHLKQMAFIFFFSLKD